MVMTEIVGSILVVLVLTGVLFWVLRRMREAEEPSTVEEKSVPPTPEPSPIKVTQRAPRQKPTPVAGGLVDGWIHLREGSLDSVRARIREHSELYEAEVPLQVEVTLATHADGAISVGFPDGLPFLILVNLLCWLDDGTGVGRCFLTAPQTQVRYALAMDLDNEWGDTAVGTGSDGSSVKVYVPEGTVTPIEEASHHPEPEPGPVAESFSMTVDVNGNFGNPQVLIG